jgi:hypothetical protein
MFKNLLEEAGYTNIECKPYEYPFDFTKDPELSFQLSMLTMSAKLDELDAWEKAREIFEKVKYDYGDYNDNGHCKDTYSKYAVIFCVSSCH